jgi:hypothetical protein
VNTSPGKFHGNLNFEENANRWGEGKRKRMKKDNIEVLTGSAMHSQDSTLLKLERSSPVLVNCVLA